MPRTTARYAWLLAGLLGLAGPALATPEDELLSAAQRDDGYRVMTLLVRGVDPNVRDAKGQTALHIALREDSEKALTSLLKHPQLDVNALNAAGETPLMLAAIGGRLGASKQLVGRGAQINREGWTPLHYACSGPDNGVARWLLAQGADIDARSPNGSTPLMLAAGYGGLSTAEMLLQAGAKPGLLNEQGLTAADFAARAGRDKFVKVLRAAADKP
jgi:ankyrin repeat protein